MDINATIREMFAEGKTWGDIAKACGVGYSTARQRGYALGLRRYPNGNKKKKNPSPSTVYNRKWQSKNPEKRAAHKAVEAALTNGDLQKAGCHFCAATDTCAHHHDYSKPLSVTWLCHSCHTKFHAMERKGHAIETHMTETPSGKRVAEYRLG